MPLLRCILLLALAHVASSVLLLARPRPVYAQPAYYGSGVSSSQWDRRAPAEIADEATGRRARRASVVYLPNSASSYSLAPANVSNQIPPARPMVSGSRLVNQSPGALQPFPEEIAPYGPPASTPSVMGSPSYGALPAPAQQPLPPSGYMAIQDPFQEQIAPASPIEAPCGPGEVCEPLATSGGFRWFGLMDLLDHDYGLFYNPPCLDEAHLLSKWTMMNFSVFTGFQGFKGPADEGAGSNFGFHEGFNWSVPLFEDHGISHQTGVQGVHSDLSGGSGLDAHRNQFFLTSGFYYRPRSGYGFQCGIVTDFLHDDWYSKTDLNQIRAEASLVGRIHELGFIGVYHTDVANKTSPTTGAPITWQAYDQYLAFYRRRLHGIGSGRLWGGVTGQGDVIVGGDGISPLSTHWAFQSNFNYIFPHAQSFSQSYNDQSWMLTLNLVFFPGYISPKSALNPFRPMFDVADNTIFLINQNGR